jgi:site-specific recombinase XerD
MKDPSRVRVSGPLEPFVAGFAAELRRQGYTQNSQGLQLQLAAHLSRWLAVEGLDSHALEPATVERFVTARRAAGYVNHTSAKALRPLLTYLRALGVTPPAPAAMPAGPVEELLARYRGHLTGERGLTEQTISGYVDKVRPFLAERTSAEGLGLSELCSADVTAFVASHCPRQARGSAKLTVTALRSLLGFLHREGMIERPLADAVPSVACWRLQGLPKGLDPGEVASLLASCDAGSASGRRDLAILTLLARLGLRRGEVAALSLDDIDWRSGEIVVRGKGRRSERLPLPADVGEPLAAYLQDGRPGSAEGRSLFVRVKAPQRALTPAGVTGVVIAAARRAGLGYVTAHRLRHSAAAALLRAGASLGEVGQVLRHRQPMTTAIYAKVDREALRTIARPWPGGGR